MPIPTKQSHTDYRPFSFRNDEWLSGFFRVNYYSFLTFTMRYIPDSFVAEDILQDTVIKLIVTGKEFNEENEAKAYIYRTIRNKSLNFLRDKQLKNGKLSSLHVIEAEDTFSNYVLEEEVFSRLFEEIDRLPCQTRNVFLLALDGKRNQEIADCLDIGVETVKTHKKIGKELLRERMDGVTPLLWLFWLFGI